MKDFFCILAYLVPFVGAALFCFALTCMRSEQDLVSINPVIRESNKPILIEFYGEYCGRCKQVTPLVSALYRSKYASKMSYILVDVADSSNEALMRHFHVGSIPAIYMLSPVDVNYGAYIYRIQLPISNQPDYSSIDDSIKNALFLMGA